MSAPVILVTGATGNVGAPLVEQLLEAGGAEVRVAARDPRKDPADPRITQVAFDFDRARWT